MSDKKKKQFGVWMDSHNAAVLGREGTDTADFVVLGHVVNAKPESNSNENAANNAQKMLQQKFFKEISSYMLNVDEVHVTGTGTSQEQFIKYLSETPQFKNAVADESTANKMSDDKLIEYFSKRFN